jgi:voltage-gated potassium channel
MEKEPAPHTESLIERRIEKRGLKPRVAASIIATLWVMAIVIFGIVERIVDPDTFSSIWDGMWWATQTVTTVGYGDVVPGQTAGKVIAVILMVGGLSLFGVVTGAITTAFVTRAQADTQREREAALGAKLDEMKAELVAVREQLASAAPGRSDPPDA